MTVAVDAVDTLRTDILIAAELRWWMIFSTGRVRAALLFEARKGTVRRVHPSTTYFPAFSTKSTHEFFRVYIRAHTFFHAVEVIRTHRWVISFHACLPRRALIAIRTQFSLRRMLENTIGIVALCFEFTHFQPRMPKRTLIFVVAL